MKFFKPEVEKIPEEGSKILVETLEIFKTKFEKIPEGSKNCSRKP
jgi:hypothetical protein